METKSMKIKAILIYFLFQMQFQMMGCERPMDSVENELNNYSDKIVFLSNRFGVQPDRNYYELFRMDIDGKNPTRLIEGSVDYPSFSPDGIEIVCSIAEFDGDLFKLNLRDASIVRLTYNHYGQYPIYSADGSKIAFFHKHSIFIMDSDGANLHDLTGQLSSSQPYFDLSSDGSKIVVDSSGEIIIVDIYGDSLTNITNHPANDKMPVFTPGGAKIVFISDRGGSDQIYQMNSDGSNRQRLTNVEFELYGTLRISPMSDKILYTINRAGFPTEICTMNADGSNQIILTEGFKPRFSPDSKKIVFESFRAADTGWIDIYIMNTDGQNQINLTNNPATDVYPIF